MPCIVSPQVPQAIVTVMGGCGASPPSASIDLAGVLGEVRYGDLAGYDVLHRGAGAA